MDEVKFLNLSIKYLGNELTEPEKEEFLKYLAGDQYKIRFDEINRDWQRAAGKIEKRSFNSRKAFERFVAKIDSEKRSAHSRKKRVNVFSFFQTPAFVRVAASLAVIIVASLVLLTSTNIFDKHEVEEAWHEKTTKLGEKSTLTFQDGTRIVLNAESTLKFRINSNDSTREVYLQGEAFFNVAHDPSRPFIVHCNDISTRVLGTKFNISAFAEENEIAVSLVEGKVEVTRKDESDEPVVLQPQQQLVYKKDQNISAVRKFDVESIIGWKDNVLKFSNEPLRKVLVSLQRAYGVDFELDNPSYEDLKITTNFSNTSVSTISKVIKNLTNLNYKMIQKDGEIQKIVFY